MQRIRQPGDEVGIFTPQVGTDAPVVNVDARVPIARYHLDDALDVLLTGTFIHQHVVYQVAAHRTLVFPIAQRRHDHVRSTRIGPDQRAGVAPNGTLCVQIQALRVDLTHRVSPLVGHLR